MERSENGEVLGRLDASPERILSNHMCNESVSSSVSDSDEDVCVFRVSVVSSVVVASCGTEICRAKLWRKAL